MRHLCLSMAALVFASTAMAQDLPEFAACVNEEIARFERALERLNATPDDREFDIGSSRGIGYCGSVGIVHCDRSEAPYPCQHALAAEEEALRSEILESLPAPDALDGPQVDWASRLYPRAYELAHGSSAGPDCDGATEAMEAWCEAWEANNRLRNAVLAHQIARYLGATAPAVELGWADVPPPTRPVARDDD